MKTALGVTDITALPQPKEIEREIFVMTRALQFLDQPGGKSFSLAFFNLFYETWDLIKQNKLAQAELNIKKLEKLAGDDSRLPFLQGFLAFQHQDYKKCVKKLKKISDSLSTEFREDAAFYLAYSFFKREDAANGNKYAQKIKNPDHVHQLLDLIDELKAKQQPKSRKK
jgi:hypothetical protein